MAGNTIEAGYFPPVQPAGEGLETVPLRSAAPLLPAVQQA